MRNFTPAIALAASLALTACSTTGTRPNSNSQPMQTPKHFHFKNTKVADLNYLLFLPKDYAAKSEKRWPLMLFLHGAGERGTDLEKVKIHGPPKIVAGRPEFPFILISPQCPDDEIWSSDVLIGLLDNVIKNYAVDTNRIYVTGLSMGGYGTWNLALAHPEKFAAIAPICGGGELVTVLLAGKEKERALKSLGVWAFHGAKDPVVPVDESQRMVDLFKKTGVKDVQLTVYPEAQHDSWTQTYNNPELYDWLLKHQRKTGKQ